MILIHKKQVFVVHKNTPQITYSMAASCMFGQIIIISTLRWFDQVSVSFMIPLSNFTCFLVVDHSFFYLEVVLEILLDLKMMMVHQLLLKSMNLSLSLEGNTQHKS